MSTLSHIRPLAETLHRIGVSLSRLPARAVGASALSRSRRSLAGLDDHLLSDIGLSRHEAMVEAERTAWDAPPHWRF